jgi:peptidyl-prolyl cis-trans isomerase D
MFDFVHKKRRIVQIILGLATLPFLFWGIESYRSGDGEDNIAFAAGEKISRQEFDEALRNQKENMRAAMGESFDEALMERPEVRSAVLDGLIRQRLLRHEAARVGLAVPDAQLVEIIQNIADFQEDGNFSKQRYEELLRDQGMSPRAFETRVRQELMRQQLLAPFTESAFMSNLVAERVMRLSDEKREVSLLRIQPEQFLGQMKPGDEAIKAYYDTHKSEFQLPEQVRVEYVVLSLEELAKRSTVSTDEARAYFEAHLDEFGQAEERRASHILISAPSSATDSDRAAARAKAEQLLAELKQDPERFADLAREHSQDPGSAPAGGDLGFFGRNMMTKSFEDTVFQMKPGEISGLVETEHGFHIIKLAEIKSRKKVDFADVKSQVEQEVKKEKATKLFGEMADNFSNTVYEQSDSLKPAAENFGLTVRQSGWMGRSGGEPPYFTNERMLMTIFSEDAIKDKRNTEAVEVSPNTLVSARVLDYKPATTPSLAELKDKIADRIAREEASRAALSEGKEKLAALQKGKDEVVKWGASQQVSRKEPQGLDNETVQAVFKTDITSLPSYYGLPNSQGGFTLIRVARVIEPAPPDPAEQKAFTGQLQQLLAQEELSSYLEGIKKRYDVSVKNENIEK